MTATFRIGVNGEVRAVEVSPWKRLLDVLREDLKLYPGAPLRDGSLRSARPRRCGEDLSPGPHGHPGRATTASGIVIVAEGEA